ncbi:interleukin-18 receptor 1-like [Lampris incognitus]|uniref:interleukin-18 receptor 1-like n=1 Tax=Lampris incognitus TaxID=2546036 RepID=UPI0024B4A3C6|nr:interleukin-18 receptor 1-like [Lampris incognitus]
MKLLVHLCFLSTLLQDACLMKARRTSMNVKEGEMALLLCPLRQDHSAIVTWTTSSNKRMAVKNESSVEERDMSVLIHGSNLVILKASINHQGNYSCTWNAGRNASSFDLKVTQKMTNYTVQHFQGQPLQLKCPTHLNISSLYHNSTKWQKHPGSLPTSFHGYIRRVDMKDKGVYTCTTSYLYGGQLYNLTRMTVLEVRDEDSGQNPVISLPHAGTIFQVDIGSELVIKCEAVLFTELEEIYWLKRESYVSDSKHEPVYSIIEENKKDGQILTTASLTFKEVTEEHLSDNYTCQLESPSLNSKVTVSLVQRARPRFSLVLSVVGIMVVMVVASTVIYTKKKIDITLFLRDTLGCFSSSSDGKTYDAYILCYNSDTDAGLNEDERRWIEKVLEEQLSYSLCLYNRDVLPGEAIAEAVLSCIKRSRRVVLIPSSPDPGSGCGLLTAIHSALVERQTHLILIKTEQAEVAGSGPQRDNSFLETLRLLAKTGNCVTWRGPGSQSLTSSFWRQLRYYLTAPRQLSSMETPLNSYSVC